jgi:succinoglycan biosynthesis transport protein ExoP
MEAFMNPKRKMRPSSLNDILQTFSRRKEMVLIPVVIFAGLFLAVSLIVPATYESEAKLLVKERRGVLHHLQQKYFMDYRTERVSYLQAQMEIIQSNEVARRVLSRLNPGQKDLSLNQINRFKKSIKVFSPPGYDLTNSDILLVRVTDHNPENAAKGADGLSEEYINYTYELKGRTDKQTVDFLEKQAQIQLEKMRQAEDQIKNFEKRSGPELAFLIATCRSKGTPGELVSLNQDFLRAKTSLVESEQFLARLKTMVQEGTIPPKMFRDNPVLATVRENLIRLEGQLAGLQERYGEVGLKTRVIQKKIEKNKQIFNQEIKADLQGRAVEMTALKTRLDSFKKVMDQYSGLAQKQLDYSKLVRAYEILEEGYQDLLRDLQQARFSQAMDLNKLASIEIIDPPQVPKHSVSPNILFNTLLGGMIGIIAGLILAFVFSTLDQTFQSSTEVEQYLSMPVLGSVPRQ